MEIKKMNLGSQGLIVPNIGLGCMGMTGFQEAHMYGKADEQEAIATIHRSLELGGNFLDTADLFTAPNQVQYLDIENMECGSGYLLIIHPDFLLKHPLATTINTYGYFSYAVNEALHLSADEENDLITILKKIDKECEHIDRHTQEIILSQIDLLLNYSNRFYERQFITRKNNNHELLIKFEQFVKDYFISDTANQGLLTVHRIAEHMNLSPNYLSDLLRVHTGQNTQQHIHDKLIEKAKEKLSTTSSSVSEIAYALGFEHSQSFSTLFKKKTNMSPLEFRQAFN